MKKWYYQVLPIFALVMAIFWGYETWKNHSNGNTTESMITLAICIMFTIGFIGSLILRVKK